MAIILRNENVASETVAMLFTWCQTQNNSATSHVAGICVLGASYISRFIKMSQFLFILVLTLKKLKQWSKNKSTSIWVLETQN